MTKSLTNKNNYLAHFQIGKQAVQPKFVLKNRDSLSEHDYKGSFLV